MNPPEVLAVAYVALTGAYGPLWVAKEEGLFARHDLDVSLRQLTPTAGVQALISGDVDLYAGGTAALAAAVAGAPIVYIGSIVDRFVMSLFVQPEIERLTDLKDRTIGVTQPGTPTDAGARIVLRGAGLVLDQDVKLSYLDAGSKVLAALQQKTIHGGLLSPPLAAAARKAGLRELVELGTLAERFPQTAFVARRTSLDSHRDVLLRFFRGYCAGVRLAREDPARAREVIATYTGAIDPDATAENYAAFAPCWALPPRVSEASIRTALAISADPRSRAVEPGAFIDDGIVDELIAAGLFA